jgi:hypothetical protein
MIFFNHFRKKVNDYLRNEAASIPDFPGTIFLSFETTEQDCQDFLNIAAA